MPTYPMMMTNAAPPPRGPGSGPATGGPRRGGVGSGGGGTGLQPRAGGGPTTPSSPGGGSSSVPAWGPGGNPGGGGGPLTIPGGSPLTITAQPSPEMQAAISEWQKRMNELQTKAATVDPNLQYQIEQYKARLGTDNTQHSIDRAGSAIRDQMAGLGEQADAAGAAAGRGPGYQAGAIAESGQRALAGQAADIESNRQAQLDALVLGGQGIMSAPGQQAQGYQAMLNSMYGQNPYGEAAQLGLGQQELGLKAYLGQLGAQNDWARTQASLYGSPWQMFQQLYGGL